MRAGFRPPVSDPKKTPCHDLCGNGRGSRAEFDDSKKPQIWHLIRPGSETVNNPDRDSFRPPRSEVKNPRGRRSLTVSWDLLTWTACTGMKVADFCVLAVPGTRTEWSEIKDRVDLAAVATNLLGPAPKRQGPRLLWPCPFHDDHDPSFRLIGTGSRGVAGSVRLEGTPPSWSRRSTSATSRPPSSSWLIWLEWLPPRRRKARQVRY